MSTDLVKYNAAKKALAEAYSIDEVKDIRDKAVAMRMYAMQAKDRVLIDQATEIRLRAERRAGELLKDVEKNGGAVPGKTGRKARPVLDTTPKLSDLGVNKSQSSRWQKLAAIPDGDFEEVVNHARQKAATAVNQPRKRRTKAEIEAETAEHIQWKFRAGIESDMEHGRPVLRTAWEFASKEQRRDFLNEIGTSDQEITALRNFFLFMDENIREGKLKLTGDPERFRKWCDLRDRVVKPLVEVAS
jgi:hypothetical protein